MENKRMTAVEWLQGQYYESEGKLTRKDFEQAKAMEEEQISNGYYQGLIDGMNNSPKEYYNETYGKE